MKKIILVAETGSDITVELAMKYGIEIVPMHVSFGEDTMDDGDFPVEKIVEYYKTTGKLPTTSGSTPADFEAKFDEIHAKYPKAHILYLAYSAITTCSYQSAVIASEGRDYVTAIDTKMVSIGQANIVCKMAEILNENPDMEIEEAVQTVNKLIERTKMCFLPDTLEFLRAGGRVSNMAFLGASILGLHPCIELMDGKLMATKKFRGKMKKVAIELVQEYVEKYKLDRSETSWIANTVGFSEEIKEIVKEAVAKFKFKEIKWLQAHGVITTHGGPAAFGFAGFAEA
jgi:DegV family protein with EDD domain